MASVRQKLALGVICAVFLFHQVNADCNKTIGMIESCWTWFDRFPTSCNETPSMVKCAKNYKTDECHFLLQWEALHRTKMYTKFTNIACNDETFQQEFPKNDDCWKETRKCAMPIVQMEKKISEETCPHVITEAHKCMASDNPVRSSECNKLLNRFIGSLIDTTVCRADISTQSTILMLGVSLVAILTA